MWSPCLLRSLEQEKHGDLVVDFQEKLKNQTRKVEALERELKELKELMAAAAAMETQTQATCTPVDPLDAQDPCRSEDSTEDEEAASAVARLLLKHVYQQVDQADKGENSPKAIRSLFLCVLSVPCCSLDPRPLHPILASVLSPSGRPMLTRPIPLLPTQPRRLRRILTTRRNLLLRRLTTKPGPRR